jgi:hypothetical protein
MGANGQNLKFWRSTRRAIGDLLAALPLFVGFLWVLVDDRRQGWHDKLADSIVVCGCDGGEGWPGSSAACLLEYFPETSVNVR